MTYEFLQHYWCFVVALLGALLVFLLFVQGANSLAGSLGYMYIVGSVVVSEVFKLIIVGVVYMLQFIPSAEAIVGIGFGLTFVVRAFLTYIFGLLVITFPLKYSENYRFNVAMSYSARVMLAKRGKLIMLSLAYPVARYVVMALAYFARPLDALVYAVAIFFGLTFIPCFAFKQYYDDVGGERRDVSQIIFG